MEQVLTLLAAGAALGLASALHCATMCGGISAGLLSMMAPPGERARAQAEALALMQAGRITAYVTLGAAAGLLGSGLFDLLIDPRLAARILNWAAAASLMWIGLSVAGLAPQLVSLGGPLRSISTATDGLLRPLRRHRRLAPYASGLSWGVCPCPMVFGALFTAALTGSPEGGATLMAGFGAGTLPAVIAATFGWKAVSLVKANWATRLAAGLAITASGAALVLFKIPLGSAICLTQP